MLVGKSCGESNDTKYALAVPAMANNTAAMISFFFILILVSRYAKAYIVSRFSLTAARACANIFKPTRLKRRAFYYVFTLSNRA